MRLGLYARGLLDEIYQKNCQSFPVFRIEQSVRIEPTSKKKRGNSRIRAVMRLCKMGLVSITQHTRVPQSRSDSILHRIDCELTEAGMEFCSKKLEIK